VTFCIQYNTVVGITQWASHLKV